MIAIVRDCKSTPLYFLHVIIVDDWNVDTETKSITRMYVITFLSIRIETLDIIGVRTGPAEHMRRLGSKILMMSHCSQFAAL